MSYAKFGVSINGLEFDGCSTLDWLRVQIEEAVKKLHPGLRFDGDVDVELEEHSGKCDLDGAGHGKDI